MASKYLYNSNNLGDRELGGEKGRHVSNPGHCDENSAFFAHSLSGELLFKEKKLCLGKQRNWILLNEKFSLEIRKKDTGPS